MSQAIKIGQDMEAKFIMLTHFSQRYSAMPVLPENMPDNVGVAFDFMKVSMVKIENSDTQNIAIIIINF